MQLLGYPLYVYLFIVLTSTPQVNTLTLEWRDGLMALSVRDAVSDTSDDHKWVVCDGPVDALWIENMNTVLDDNKMLCLANSERIKLTPSIHMMFEVRAEHGERIVSYFVLNKTLLLSALVHADMFLQYFVVLQLI